MRVSALWFWVEPLEEARTFYRDVLGLKEDYWNPERGKLEFSGEGGPPLYLRRKGRPGQPAGVPVIGLRFDDLAQLRQRLEGAGVATRVMETLESGGQTHEVLAFADPYGHRFEAWPWALRDAVKPVAVAGVVTDNVGRVMLVHAGEGSWGLPGGVVDENEGPLEALRREFDEELRVRPVDPQLSGVYHMLPYDGIRMIFRCGVDGEPRPAAEIAVCEYVELRRLEELTRPWLVDRILDALDFAGRAVVREQRRDAAQREIPSRPRPW